MIQSLTITNYRSIAQATVQLQPFTVLVGANGSGKSNLLKLLSDLSRRTRDPRAGYAKHYARSASPTKIEIRTDEDSVVLVEKENANTTFTTLTERLASLGARTDSLGAVWYSGLVGGVTKTDITW